MSVISKFLGDIISPFNKAAFSQLQLYNGVSNGAVLMSTKVTLTSAQILALNTTPVTLIPAQGANTYIEIISGVAKLDYNTATYTGANALNLNYTNGSGVAVAGALPTSGFLDATTSAAYKITPAAGISAANAPVVASVGTANPAAGDGTITFDLFYRVNQIT